MVSDASKKKAAQKKAAAAAKRGGKAAAASSKSVAGVSSDSQNGAEKLANGFDSFAISDRTCTGVLCSHPLSRDIRVSHTPPQPFAENIGLEIFTLYCFCVYIRVNFGNMLFVESGEIR